MVVPIKQLRDEIEEKTASSLQQPVSVVNDVMSWVFKDVIKAFRKYNEVELSGFGSFILSPAKINRRIVNQERMKRLLEAKPQTEIVLKKLESLNNSLQYFYTRLDGMEKNLGRVAQLSDSTKGNEGANSESGVRASGNLPELS